MLYNPIPQKFRRTCGVCCESKGCTWSYLGCRCPTQRVCDKCLFNNLYSTGVILIKDLGNRIIGGEEYITSVEIEDGRTLQVVGIQSKCPYCRNPMVVDCLPLCDSIIQRKKFQGQELEFGEVEEDY